MAQPPILTLDDISLGFGTNPLFQGLGLGIMGGERLCLVGRNGAGKSTLLKVIAGLIEPDGGKRFTQPGAKIAYLRQEPDFSGYETLGEFAGADLDPSEYYKAEMAMEGLEVKADAHPSTASGGEKRRAALARTIAAEPDLMLLDEPTNHLDIGAIEWLENHLAETRTAYVLISHDRRFIRSLATRIIELDRGKLTSWPGSYEKYLSGKQAALDAEERANAEFDKKLSQEEKWIRQGIKARRTRNEGRVRALKAMRDEFAQRRNRTGTASLTIQSGDNSGKVVVEAEHLNYTVDGKTIVEYFSVNLLRGGRARYPWPQWLR